MPFQEQNPYIDTLLLNALRNDDEAALNHLFSTYYNRLFRTGLKYGSTNETVEEAIQAVFIDLWHYRKTLGDVQSFEAYLTGSLRKRLTKMGSKTAKNAVSRRKIGMRKDAYTEGSLKNREDAENDILLSVEAYENVLILQETNDLKRNELKNALEQLTPRQKELIVMRYFEEMNYADIAEKTQLQTDSIYKTIHEALKRLRLILGKT
jgi:RNA polymerase sigma factor (sigma-70 family)